MVWGAGSEEVDDSRAVVVDVWTADSSQFAGVWLRWKSRMAPSLMNEQPLSERSGMSLSLSTRASAESRGARPAGPAGYGKAETEPK